MIEHLEDELNDAQEDVHQLQLQQQGAVPPVAPVGPPEPPLQVSGVELGVGPQGMAELSDAESSVGESVVPPSSGRMALLANEQNFARLQEEFRVRGIVVESIFEYQPPH